MRKRVKTEKIDPMMAAAKAKNLPAFNEKPGRIRPRYFWSGKTGSFSKRAFFFSLFALIAIVYILLCMTGLVVFSTGLGTFIIACNTAFGINYYANEKLKDTFSEE